MKAFPTLAITTLAIISTAANGQTKRIPITFTGGYETDRRDGGRPIILIAAALGVPSEVFRKAFSGVTPARGRAPEPEQVRRNKDALLSVLSPYGITNDRLDTVSDYYRYQPERGERWPATPAQAYAVVSKGKIVSIKITRPGSGYSSPPSVLIPGFENLTPVVTVSYSKQFEVNGAVRAISITQKR